MLHHADFSIGIDTRSCITQSPTRSSHVFSTGHACSSCRVGVLLEGRLPPTRRTNPNVGSICIHIWCPGAPARPTSRRATVCRERQICYFCKLPQPSQLASKEEVRVWFALCRNPSRVLPDRDSHICSGPQQVYVADALDAAEMDPHRVVQLRLPSALQMSELQFVMKSSGLSQSMSCALAIHSGFWGALIVSAASFRASRRVTAFLMMMSGLGLRHGTQRT